MTTVSSAFHAQSSDGERFFEGESVRCSFSSNGESAGCWHGKISRITSRGIYIDVGNKRDKYVCFVDVQELSKVL